MQARQELKNKNLCVSVWNYVSLKKVNPSSWFFVELGPVGIGLLNEFSIK